MKKKAAGLENIYNESVNFFASFFGNLNHQYNSLSRIQTYAARSVIFDQDSAAEAVYLVESGLVKLVRLEQAGREVIIDLRRPPWMLGAPCVLLEKPYPYTAVTLIQSSLRRLQAKVFQQIIKTNKLFSYQICLLLSRQILDHMKRLEAISCMSAKKRLAQLLCDLICAQEPAKLQKPHEFQVPLKNEELAQMVSVTREHLCRLLREMEKDGVVTREKRVLTIVNPAGLLQKMEDKRIISPHFISTI